MGSEMCIRDRYYANMNERPKFGSGKQALNGQNWVAAAGPAEQASERRSCCRPVEAKAQTAWK